MSPKRPVLAFYDERRLQQSPEIGNAFLPGRLERRVKRIIAELDYRWGYLEHPGRLSSIRERLAADPIPGAESRTRDRVIRTQLARVHTQRYLDSIFDLRGKRGQEGQRGCSHDPLPVAFPVGCASGETLRLALSSA